VSDVLVFIVAGMTLGSLYGLTATGLTLTYKTSGILNFAHGALAIVAVDAYIYLSINRGWSWELSAFVAIVIVGALMGIVLERLGRSVVSAAPALRVVAMVGLSVAITGATALIGRRLIGSHPHFHPPPLPGTTVKLAGVYVGKDQLIVIAVSLVAVAALWLFLRGSRTGVALRAVVDDPDLVDASGRDPRMLRRVAWCIGAMFAALSGVLLAISPTFGGGAGGLSLLVVPAFGAAAIGRFKSLPWSYAGGLLIGISASLMTRYLTTSWLLAVPSSLPVIVLFVVLLATPKRHLAERWQIRRRMVSTPAPLPTRYLLTGGALVTIVLLALPSFSGFQIGVYTTWLIYAMIFASLGLLVRTSGQVSLCQLGLAAVGASTFAHLSGGSGLPWGIALLGAAIVTAAVGAIIAVSAIRLAGVFLALATLAFGSILQQFFYTSSLMFGRSIALQATRPSFARGDAAFHDLVVVIFVVMIVGVVTLGRTRLGRLLRGLADAPLALEAQGASINVTKLVVFALSAGLAGIAGALLASLNNVAASQPFSPQASLTMVAVLFVLPFGEPLASLAAGAAFYLLPIKLNIQNVGAWTNLVFGLAAVVVSTFLVGRSFRFFGVRRASRRERREPIPVPIPMVPLQPGVPAAPAELTLTPSAPAIDDTPTLVAAGPAVRPGGAGAGGGLVASNVSVHFGGILALDSVSLTAPVGRITGLIGPNGAGKTTFFNVSTGVVRPSGGSVVYDGRTMSSRIGTAGRARLGLGRTFQQPQLFESMTVGEMLALGREAGLAGSGPWAQVLPSRGDNAAVRDAVAYAIEVTEIGPLLDVPAGDLSTGEKRLVELARCLAGPFDLLLLDEPSAGLDRSETSRMSSVIRRVVREHGIGVLLVEHDMAVVMELCDHVYVLDFGRMIFDGTPDDVRASPIVRSAYLGTEVPLPA
jgi:ABC-type branched-subunit amino acid transport system ATPase component/branched-subunit amino acid ABC-type transport system permease component